MTATRIDDLIRMDRHTLVKTILYIKLLEKKSTMLTDNDLNVLSLFTYTDDKEVVISDALSRGYKKSRQAVENAISKMVVKGILSIPERKKRLIDSELFPKEREESFISTLIISDIDFKSSQLSFSKLIPLLHASN